MKIAPAGKNTSYVAAGTIDSFRRIEQGIFSGDQSTILLKTKIVKENRNYYIVLGPVENLCSFAVKSTKRLSDEISDRSFLLPYWKKTNEFSEPTVVYKESTALKSEEELP
jgi:hypothetical protein